MQSISINGLQIHSNTVDLGYVVNMPILGLDFPQIRFSQYPKPGEHGAIVTSQFFDGRTITLNGRLSGNTVAQHLLNRRTLTNILRVIMNSLEQATPLTLQFTTLDGLNLQCECYASKAPQLTERGLNHSFFMIELFAPDYNLYDQSQQVSTINVLAGGGVTYPVTYPVTYGAATGGSQTIANSGDSDTYPVITLYGPLTTPYITNVTLQKSFSVNLSLSASDVLVIDMKNKTMVLNGNQNALAYFVSTNTWLSLQPGNNLVNLGTGISSDTGYAQVAFRNAFIGV